MSSQKPFRSFINGFQGHWHRRNLVFIDYLGIIKTTVQYIRNGFTPGIRTQGGVDWWKQPKGGKISCQCPFTLLQSCSLSVNAQHIPVQKCTNCKNYYIAISFWFCPEKIFGAGNAVIVFRPIKQKQLTIRPLSKLPLTCQAEILQDYEHHFGPSKRTQEPPSQGWNRLWTIWPKLMPLKKPGYLFSRGALTADFLPIISYLA
jgi:hypothetical protein